MINTGFVYSFNSIRLVVSWKSFPHGCYIDYLIWYIGYHRCLSHTLLHYHINGRIYKNVWYTVQRQTHSQKRDPCCGVRGWNLGVMGERLVLSGNKVDLRRQVGWSPSPIRKPLRFDEFQPLLFWSNKCRIGGTRPARPILILTGCFGKSICVLTRWGIKNGGRFLFLCWNQCHFEIRKSNTFLTTL